MSPILNPPHPYAPALIRTGRSAWIGLPVVLAVFGVLLSVFWIGYLGSDDATYAQGAYGWLTTFPYVGGHGTIRYTITLPIAAAFAILGEGEFSLVLPTLIYSLALVVLIYATIHRWFGPWPAILSSMILVTSPLLVIQSTIASIDVVEAAFVLSSFIAFCSCLYGKPSAGRLMLSGALAGLAYVTRETAVFLLVCYGILFLFKFGGLARKSYFVMAAGFLAVEAAELVFLGLFAGDPFYRFSVSINHDTINRLIDNEGNLLVHPAIDPLLVLLINQEFSLLFWAAIPAGLWLAFDRRVPRRQQQIARAFGILGATWIACVGLAYDLLPLNPRYFMVGAIAAAILLGVALHQAWSLARARLALLAATLVIAANLGGLAVENIHYMFGERMLARMAATHSTTIHTDPMTAHRADLLLRWDKTAVSAAPPPVGALYLYNPPRSASPNRLMSAAALGDYQPKASWEVIGRYRPEPKLPGRVLAWLGILPALPAVLAQAVTAGHPGVTLFRVRE